jgi:hypothetical protein
MIESETAPKPRFSAEPPLDPQLPPTSLRARDADGREVVLTRLVVPPDPHSAHEIVQLRARLSRQCGEAHTAIELVRRGYGYLVVADCYGDSTLAELLALSGTGAAALPLAEALDLAHELVAALATIHARNGYHGNLTPGNLLLRSDEQAVGRYAVKLTNLALLPFDQDLPLDPDSLAYSWTPERVRGDAGSGLDADVRGRAEDSYSLGGLLFHLFAGRPPRRAATRRQLSTAHLYDTPPVLHSLRPELSPAFAELVDRCFSQEPFARSDNGELRAVRPSAAELLVAIKAEQRAYELRIGRHVFGPQPVPAEGFPQLECRNNLATDAAPVRASLTGAGRVLGCGVEWEQQFGAVAVADSEVVVDWDGAYVSFSVRQSTGAIVYEGQPVADGETRLWDWGERLTIGPYEVALLAPTGWLPPSVPREAATIAAPAPVLSAQTDELQMSLALSQRVVRPGESVAALLSIANRRSVIENLTLSVERAELEADRTPNGAAPLTQAAWVRGLPGSVNLFAGQQETWELQIEVPAVSKSAAGPYRLAIRGESQARPGEYVRDEQTLEVLPFYGCAVEIKPRRRSGRWRGNYTLTVQNTGNTNASYHLAGEDDAYALRFELGRATLDLPPGHREARPLVVRPTGWHLLGAAEQHLFQIQATGTKSGSGLAGARFDRRALVPSWLIALALLLLLCCTALAYLARLVPQLDKPLGAQPLYGVLRPTEIPSATPSATTTPTATPLLVIPDIVPPTDIATSTTTATLAPSATITPTVIITPTATVTPTMTPSLTPTQAPMPEGALAFCPRGTPIMVEVVGRAGEAFVLRFHDYQQPVSLGQLDAPLINLRLGPDGRFVVPLIIGTVEEPGVYRVRAELLDGTPLRTFYCRVLAPGAGPSPTPTSTATETPTPTPTVNPSITVVPPTLTPEPSTPTPTATPTSFPIADGDYVLSCPRGSSREIAGIASPNANFQLFFNGDPIGDLLAAGPDGRFLVELRVPPGTPLGVFPVQIFAVDGQLLRSFYCDTFGSAAPASVPQDAPETTTAPNPNATPATLSPTLPNPDATPVSPTPDPTDVLAG